MPSGEPVIQTSGEVLDDLAGKVIEILGIDFTNVVQALNAAHYPTDDPIRRAIGAFDFPDILDEHEAGYDRRA